MSMPGALGRSDQHTFVGLEPADKAYVRLPRPVDFVRESQYLDMSNFKGYTRSTFPQVICLPQREDR